MKKTIRTILYTVVFAVLAVSCQKENNEVEPVGITSTRGTIEISVNGLMGEYTQVDATKASLVNTVRVSWEGGETVYVYDGTQCLGSLVASLDGTEDRYALLSTDNDHKVNAPATGTEKLTLVYSPLLTEAPVVSKGAISISIANQSSAKAPFVVYATLDYVEGQKSIENLIVPFSFATSVVRVSCTGLSASTDIDKAEVGDVNTSCVLSFADGSVEVSGTDNGTITRLTADGFNTVNIEGDACFQIAVPALGTSSGRTLTIEQEDFEYIDENFSNASIAPNYSVNTICTMRVKDTITPDSPVGTIGVIGGRKAMVVNLYGAKYAVALMNEGATAESGAGSYGDYYGFDEAATFFHGSDLNVWRVPSMDEMKGLTDMTRAYDSETPAVKFVLKDASISFPLAGLHLMTEGSADVGVAGTYYTSTPLPAEGVGDIVCVMSYLDEKPYVEYAANPSPNQFELSLRLFYQLTESDPDILHGRFTVNAEGDQVYFSKGNLQAKYNGSSYSWGFAPNQYDIIGSGNENIASPVEGTALDLFGWSTASTCYGISTSKDNKTYEGDFLDWGTALGSNIWRTLSIEEWKYLIGSRILKDETESGYGKTCVLATINGATGLIVFCDNYTGEKKDLSTIPEGCVFLPAAGNRGLNSDTDSQSKYENHGYIIYWSATPDYEASRSAYNFQLEPNPYDEYYYYSARSTRNIGYAVRLVTDCE